MSEQIIRTERQMVGNKAVQKTTYSDGQAEGTAALIVIAAGVLAILSPFAVLLWLAYHTSAIIHFMGGHHLVKILAVMAEIAVTFTLFIVLRPFRYLYIIFNAVIVAHLTYVALSYNPNFAAVVAAVLSLVALIGGIIGEVQLERAGMSSLFKELRAVIDRGSW